MMNLTPTTILTTDRNMSGGNAKRIPVILDMDVDLYRLLTLPAAKYNEIDGENLVLETMQRRTQALRTLLLNNNNGDWHVLSRQCDICRQYFPSAQHLITHRYTHTLEHVYRCLICYNVCDYKSTFKRHMNTHSGVKPYECDVCHKRFTVSNTLTIHMRTHTGEKPYKCDICHMEFAHNGSLTGHMSMHTGEKPYKCNICHRRFSRKYNLSAHTRTHTATKQFECDICHNRFSRKDNITAHMRRVHAGQKSSHHVSIVTRHDTNSILAVHKQRKTSEKPHTPRPPIAINTSK